MVMVVKFRYIHFNFGHFFLPAKKQMNINIKVVYVLTFRQTNKNFRDLSTTTLRIRDQQPVCGDGMVDPLD